MTHQTYTPIETAQEVTLGEITETFLEEELLATSKQTRKWYRARLTLFLAAVGESRPISDISKLDLITWWKQLETRCETKPPTLAVDTFYSYARAVRRLFRWMYEQHYTVVELWRVVKLPKLPERQRKGISNANIKKFFEAARENPRDYAILRLMESTGCRRGGVATLTLSDLAIDDPLRCRRVVVHEKGLRSRTVVMSQATLESLRAWLAVRPASACDYVFTDCFAPYDGLSPGAISSIITRYKKKSSITGKCSPHQWRHHFCRARLLEGMPLSNLSQLAGHKTITITANIYGNLLSDELQASYDKFYRPVEDDTTD